MNNDSALSRMITIPISRHEGRILAEFWLEEELYISWVIASCWSRRDDNARIDAAIRVNELRNLGCITEDRINELVAEFRKNHPRSLSEELDAEAARELTAQVARQAPITEEQRDDHDD